MAWAEAMEAKGYLSKSQLAHRTASPRQGTARAAQGRRRIRLFRRFEIPKEIQTLARTDRDGRDHPAGRGRPAQGSSKISSPIIRKQIENCIVRAPHDGVVVYALGNRWRPLAARAGNEGLPGSVMFVLPDLSQMDVEVSVHESVGPQRSRGDEGERRAHARGQPGDPGSRRVDRHALEHRTGESGTRGCGASSRGCGSIRPPRAPSFHVGLGGV